MFRVNEICFDHVIAFVEGIKKGPGTIHIEAVLNHIPKLDKPNIENLVPHDQLDLPVTRITKVHLKTK